MVPNLSPDQLIAAAPDDPFVRASVLGGRVTRGPWATDGAYLWGVTRHDEPVVMGVGDPAGAATLLQAVAAEHPDFTIASLPRGWVEHLGADVSVAVRDHWDWFAASSAPPPVHGEAGASWLSGTDDEIRALLTAASPETSTWPGDDRACRWAGIRAPDGTLVAVLADTSRHRSMGHISSVATAPEHRRRGHAAALTAWVMRQFFTEGAEMVTLGMYASNDAARKMYERLGFTCHHRFASAALNRQRSSAPVCADA